MKNLSSLFRLDAWKNVLAGIGSRKDKSTLPVDSVPGFPRLVDVQLEALYYTDGRIKNAVNIIAEKMMQNGFEVEGDDGSLFKAFGNLNGPAAFTEALKWTRVFGGAIIVLDVAGAGEWDTPWDPSKGGKIRELRVYPRTRVELGMMETVKMPESLYFEKYERYILQSASGTFFTVHASRCIIFKSVTKVDAAFPGWLDYERFWGLSAIYEGLEDAHHFGTTVQGISHLVKECSIVKYKMSNLEQLVAENNYKAIETRMEAIDEQKSIINGVMLGEGEDCTRENFSFAGLPEIWDRQAMSVAGSYRIPVTLLFGRSAAGMNATGQGDDDNFNSYIAGLQQIQVLPPLLKLMGILNAGLKAVDVSDGSLTINFNPLSKRDQKADAETREIQSRTDKNYMDAGVLSQEEVRKNRFVGGYALDTSVEDEVPPSFSLEGEGGKGE